MNSEDTQQLQIGIMLLLIAIAIGGILTAIRLNSQINEMREMSIKQNCAHYNSVDGHFEWLRKGK